MIGQIWQLLSTFAFYATLMLLLLVPLLWQASAKFRFLVTMGAYYAVILAAGICSLPLVAMTPRNPENYRKVGWIFLKMSAWMDTKWEMRRMDILKDMGTCVIVCNHQSSIDLMGMMYLLPDRCVSLIKKELQYLPLWGWCASLSGSVFIDRFNTQNAVAKMQETVDYVKNKQLKLWMFPEGTRYHERGMLPFKKGGFHLAVQGQIPIVPVVFSCYAPFYSKPEWRFRPGGLVISQVLNPIPTEGLKSEDVPDLVERTRSKMLEVFEIISVEAEMKNKSKSEGQA